MIALWDLFERWALRMLCVLALLFVGFAHKPLDLYPKEIPGHELAQYILPDGTVPVLCLPAGDGKLPHSGHDLGSSCEACRLTASVLLPAPSDISGDLIRREIEHLLPLRTEGFYRRLFPPNTAARGPPSELTA